MWKDKHKTLDGGHIRGWYWMREGNAIMFTLVTSVLSEKLQRAKKMNYFIKAKKPLKCK